MRYLHLALLVLALGACKDAPQSQATTSSALPYLPIPPQATVISRATSPNAVQISFHSGATPSEVLDYYRKSLPSTGWSLESDSEDAEGAYALYAVKSGHPIWIRISQTPGMPGSVISLNGAVVEPPATATDTAAGAPSGS
jgi:hypothetical protein